MASQIDYWRVSNSLADATERCYIMTCTLSDHQPVALTFPIEYFTRGPGPVLEINVDVLKEELLKVMVTNAWKDWQKAKASMEIRQWWDVGKANIKQVIQEYCTLKKQFEMAEEERLENNLEELNRIAEPDQNTLRKTHSMESTLRDAQWQKTEGARIRARVKHALEGEQNTAFFFRQIKKKTCPGRQNSVASSNKGWLNTKLRGEASTGVYGETLWISFQIRATFNSRSIRVAEESGHTSKAQRTEQFGRRVIDRWIAQGADEHAGRKIPRNRQASQTILCCILAAGWRGSKATFCRVALNKENYLWVWGGQSSHQSSRTVIRRCSKIGDPSLYSRMIYKRRCGWHRDVLFVSNASTINAFISEIVFTDRSWPDAEVNCSVNTISLMKALIVETFETNKTSLCYPLRACTGKSSLCYPLRACTGKSL